MTRLPGSTGARERTLCRIGSIRAPPSQAGRKDGRPGRGPPRRPTAPAATLPALPRLWRQPECKSARRRRGPCGASTRGRHAIWRGPVAGSQTTEAPSWDRREATTAADLANVAGPQPEPLGDLLIGQAFPAQRHNALVAFDGTEHPSHPAVLGFILCPAPLL